MALGSIQQINGVGTNSSSLESFRNGSREGFGMDDLQSTPSASVNLCQLLRYRTSSQLPGTAARYGFNIITSSAERVALALPWRAKH